MAVFFERQVGKGDVMRGDRRPVVPARLGPQHEGVAVAVLGDRHAVGEVAIDRVRLVPGVHHQRIETRLHARRRIPAAHETVHRVEGLDVLIVEPVARLEIECPARRRVRRGIVELLETGRIFQIAEGRKPVQRHAARIVRPAERRKGGARRDAAGKGQETPAVYRETAIHCALPPAASAASFSGMIHQESMSAPTYSGCFSGMPNLSHQASQTSGVYHCGM